VSVGGRILQAAGIGHERRPYAPKACVVKLAARRAAGKRVASAVVRSHVVGVLRLREQVEVTVIVGDLDFVHAALPDCRRDVVAGQESLVAPQRSSIRSRGDVAPEFEPDRRAPARGAAPGWILCSHHDAPSP
jgi:hypothetical protein